ncbi:MAG TPA: choice-of-anchor P family protein [Acidimicrobiales bacterium]|nr:choice-of-anchor P family protein [Acidimicrobiales bacterium]
MRPRAHIQRAAGQAGSTKADRIRRRLITPVAALSALTCAGGISLCWAAPAGADATAASQLGGFQTTATGAGIRTTYEQPNFPVPATPTLEGNFGFATTSYNAGPSSASTASTVWPGQVAAGFGSQLPLLLQPYIGTTPLWPLVQNVNAGPWPIQATSSFPVAPGSSADANQDSAGVTMEASSSQDAGSATCTFGVGNGKNATAALPSGVVQVQSIGSTVLAQVQGTNAGAQAMSQATAALQGISIAGGLIQIGGMTTTATSTSDGNNASVTGSSAVSQVTIAGQSVTIDKDGIHAASQNQNLLGALLPTVNTILNTAGITIALEQPMDTVNGASGERVLPGLQITIDLTKYDGQFQQLLRMLPSSLLSAVNQLPIPFPQEQIMVINLGYVDVKSAASPAFDSSGGSTDSGSGGGGDLGGAALTGSSGDLGSSGTTGFGGTSGTPGTLATTGANSPAQAIVASPVGLFKGLGAGLIALGLLLAGTLAFLLLRADAAVGAMSAAPACPGEELPDL